MSASLATTPRAALVTGLGRTLLGGMPYLLGFCSLFLVWHGVATYIVASVLFPPPLAVLVRGVAMLRDGSLEGNIGIKG